jgi:hypothetical protein
LTSRRSMHPLPTERTPKAYASALPTASSFRSLRRRDPRRAVSAARPSDKTTPLPILCPVWSARHQVFQQCAETERHPRGLVHPRRPLVRGHHLQRTRRVAPARPTLVAVHLMQWPRPLGDRGLGGEIGACSLRGKSNAIYHVPPLRKMSLRYKGDQRAILVIINRRSAQQSPCTFDVSQRNISIRA